MNPVDAQAFALVIVKRSNFLATQPEILPSICRLTMSRYAWAWTARVSHPAGRSRVLCRNS